MLEFIWSSYTEFNPIDSQEIIDGFVELEPIVEILYYDQENLLFHAVCRLCLAQEKAAFMEGLHVGVKLMTEVGNAD